MAVHTAYGEVAAYTTRDGSEIRELMHPAAHGNRAQSLAEATVAAGSSTFLHRHLNSDEIYHFLAGTGIMALEEEQITVKPGDTVWIPAGASHAVRNTGREPLRILCCCVPPYSHEDTVLLGEFPPPAPSRKDGGKPCP